MKPSCSCLPRSLDLLLDDDVFCELFGTLCAPFHTHDSFSHKLVTVTLKTETLTVAVTVWSGLLGSSRVHHTAPSHVRRTCKAYQAG